MNRHWTFDVVAVVGMLAGFALFVAGGHSLVAGMVAAGSAYALLLPELVDSDGGQPTAVR